MTEASILIVEDEVIVADDGSGLKTGRIITDTLSSSNLKWLHVRHENKGVRQSRIKNLAVKYSTCEYLIFVDHDVVLHVEFISDHLSMAEDGFFLQGRNAVPLKYLGKKF